MNPIQVPKTPKKITFFGFTGAPWQVLKDNQETHIPFQNLSTHSVSQLFVIECMYSWN